MSLLDELKSLVNRGPSAPAPVVEEPVQAAAPAVAEPAPSVPSVTEPTVIAQPEVIPVPAAVELDCYGENPEREINWEDERRIDLPQRSPARVRYLLKFETEEQRTARIQNDKERHQHLYPQDFSQKPQPETVRGNPQLYLRDA
jgi:hypothetical protein